MSLEDVVDSLGMNVTDTVCVNMLMNETLEKDIEKALRKNNRRRLIPDPLHRRIGRDNAQQENNTQTLRL